MPSFKGILEYNLKHSSELKFEVTIKDVNFQTCNFNGLMFLQEYWNFDQ